MAGNSKVAWGIDVGQYGLRAIKLEAAGAELQVSDFELIEYHQSLSDLPAASHDQTIRDALAEFASRHSLKGAAVVVAIPGRNSQARFVALPPVEPKKIPQIVEFEAKQQIPFDIDDVVWDYQAIKLDDSPDVIAGIFFVKQDVVESFLNNFQASNILTDQVQMAPMALYNALVYDGLTDPGSATVILDVGSANTEFIVADGQKVFHRTIPIGGNNFTQALVKAFKLSFSKAENLKRKCSTSKYAKQVFQAMRSVFSDLSSEVQRSIGFYTTLNRQAKITRILALGNTLRLPGLQKYLRQSLKVELIRVDQFSRLTLASQVNEAAFSAGVLSMGVAYGLALQGLGRSTINANLLPPLIRTQQVWRAKRPVFAAAVGLLALIVAGVYGGNLRDSSTLKEPLERAGRDSPRSVAQEAQNYQRELIKVQTEMDNHRKKISQYVTLLAERDIWPAMIRAITQAMKTTDDVASEYAKKRSKRRLIFIQSFNAQYSDDLDTAYDEKYSLGKALPATTALGYGGYGSQYGMAQKEVKKGFIMEIQGITPFHGDDQHIHTPIFLQDQLTKNLSRYAQAEIDKLQTTLTELAEHRVKLTFSDPVIKGLQPIERAAKKAKGKAQKKFIDPIRPNESMAEDYYFWIHWKVYLEREAPGSKPKNSASATSSGRANRQQAVNIAKPER